MYISYVNLEQTKQDIYQETLETAGDKDQWINKVTKVNETKQWKESFQEEPVEYGFSMPAHTCTCTSLYILIWTHIIYIRLWCHQNLCSLLCHLPLIILSSDSSCQYVMAELDGNIVFGFVWSGGRTRRWTENNQEFIAIYIKCI